MHLKPNKVYTEDDFLIKAPEKNKRTISPNKRGTFINGILTLKTVKTMFTYIIRKDKQHRPYNSKIIMFINLKGKLSEGTSILKDI